eukprot:CAMPEP_0113644738 /NCGR_PEP_ID=MMETSP0017_2-20120614/23552_1 /TAXON_ID=2856 /ORGANISM="Cylindrotheca closterium" /LENGTH=729 /DNA_ID=CAMNT_0000556377 /DNA_START=76 /DNA_END=2262 /DNA_ORIENTATION=+ /assembly_acc=CAM_ASM_000147
MTQNNTYGSSTVSASQNRIQRLRQQNQEARQVSPAANNLLQKRKQMKERRMKRAESAAAASSSTTQKPNTSQQDAIPRRRKLEMVQRHKAHRQANMGMGKLLNDDQHNLSPRSVDNEDADDDTLVSVRRIVASSSPGNQQDRQYLNVPSKAGNTAYRFQEQEEQQQSKSYQSNYNSLSENMHSLQKKKTPNKRNGQSRQKYYSEQRPWLEDEKSEKVNNRGSYLTASSSEYDTDKESQMMGLEGQSYSKSADGNDYNSSPLHKQNNGDNYYSSRAYPRRFHDDDDKTFDYGDRDDDYSADSGSYAARRWKEAERRKALAAELDSPKENSSAGNASESPFINKEDAEHFKQKIDAMDSPALRIGVGVAGAATIGAVVGPVGLLVGAAAISVGFSLSQIPEEDRNKLQTKATQSMYEFHDKACEVSDKLSTTCATHYHDSGVAEHIPPQIAENLPQCISNPDDQVLDDGVVDDTAPGNADTGKPTVDTSKRELPSQSGVVKPTGVGSVRTERVPDPRLPSPTKPERPYPQNKRNKKVACLRNVRILPAGRIYGLDPVAQPRAWLDVVASANTSHEEKNEAMEEILILAKDKRRARILLEEGILDYIIWEVGRYLEKVNHTTEDWKHAKLTPDEEHAARQAATCCVTLGKAHCAAIHTEGDLQLMSLYERGIVPEDRQVAQMLHEVPHHVRITKTSDPTVVDPSKEVFAYRELELPQAEELAKSIKLVADGK